MQTINNSITILILIISLLLASRYVVSAELQTTIATDKTLAAEFDLKCKILLTNAADECHLIFNYKDKSNYYYLRAVHRKITLIKIKDGKKDTLAEVGQIEIPLGKAIEIFLKRRKSRIVCTVGQTAIVRAEDNSFSKSKIGFAISSKGVKISGIKYQKIGEIQFTDDFMRKEGESNSWQITSGTWQIDEIDNPEYSASPFRYIGKSDPSTHASIVTTGYWFWDNYVFKAAIKPGNRGASVGLCFYYKDEKNYYLYRVVGEGTIAGRAQLVKMFNGKETVLAERKVGLDAAQWYEFTVAICDDIVRAYIDGNLIFDLQVKDPGYICGKAGLYLMNSEGTLFDDVVIKSIKASPLDFTRSNYGALKGLIHDSQPVIAERFKTDRLMMVWSSKQGEFERAKGRNRNSIARNILWHQGIFYGNVSAKWKGRLRPLPNAELKIAICADPRGGEINSGYMLDIKFGNKTDRPIVILSKAGKELRRANFSINKSEENRCIKLSRIGSTISASIDYPGSAGKPNSKVILEYEDHQPIKGGKVAFAAYKIQLSPFNLDAISENVCDYTFFRAPVDWRVETGKWDITSRWICNPKYTWLGGISKETAVMWNKRIFSGDITLNLYLAMHMDYGRFMGYNRRGDLNVTICGDGKDISSGYNFVFGGWDNTWTRILKGEKIVAETNNFLCPENRGVFHNTWFHVMIQKIKNELFYYINGKLILTYTDPEPLSGKHVALWTYDGGLMIARATIYYEKTEGIPLPKMRSLNLEEKRKEKMPLRIRISSPTHPSTQTNFEMDSGGWVSRGDENSAVVRLTNITANSGRSSLEIVNPKSGGDFAVNIPPQRFDATKFNKLSFAYKISPKAKVNLYLKVNGVDHVILFNGAGGSQEKAKVLGKIEAIADNAWHRAEFNLLRALQTLYPTEAEITDTDGTSQNITIPNPSNQFIIEDLHIGNWSNKDYLLAGFGGNYRGTTYYVDDFFLGTPGGPKAVFRWRVESNNQKYRKLEYSYLLDQKQDSVPDNIIEGDTTETSFGKVSSGTWYFHIKARDKDGNWTETSHFRIEVDNNPPTVILQEQPLSIGLVPSDKTKHLTSKDSKLVFQLSDEDGVGINPKSVKFTLSHSDRKITTDHTREPIGRYDPVNETLSLNLNTLGPFINGSTIELAISASDLLGNKTSPIPRWRWKVDYSKDKIGPQVLVATPTPILHPFSISVPHSPGVVLKRYRSDGLGDYAFSVYNKSVGGVFRCYITRSIFDPRKYPVVSFDYKIPPGARFDLSIEATEPASRTNRFAGGNRLQIRSIILSDTGRACPPIGSIPYLKLDNKWHHADINLYKMLRSVFSSRGIVVSSLAFIASEQGRDLQEMKFHIANFSLNPVINAVDGLSLKCLAHDISGVAGYSYVLDDAPQTIPDNKMDSTLEGRTYSAEEEITFKGIKNGLHYFHIKAKDRVGNWGPVNHIPIVIQNSSDKAPPLAEAFSPADAASAATDKITLNLRDGISGVSLGDIQIWVDGTRYSIADPCVSYNERTGKLQWNRRIIEPPLPTFPNGKLVKCKLEASDYAGNKMSPISWTWKFDYSKDKSPPQPPGVVYIPSRYLVRDTFESSLGEWKTRRAGWSKLDRSTSATGKGCVNFGGFSVFARSTPFMPARYPFISFDYNIPRGGAVDFIFRTNNNNWEITLNASRKKYTPIGAIPGIIADGKWHHAEFNFYDAIKANLPNASSLVVDHLATMTMFGGSYYIDNFMISANRGDEVRFEWDTPSDPTGILGYSYTLNHAPKTLPDEVSEGIETSKSYKELDSGVWYFHLRAQDGAGNWGAASHLRFTIGSEDTH